MKCIILKVNNQHKLEVSIEEKQKNTQVVPVDSHHEYEAEKKTARPQIKYAIAASVVFGIFGFWLGSTFNRPPYPLPEEDGLYEVRQWLKIHLDDPYWEEIRFWPARRIPEIVTESLLQATKDLEEYKKNTNEADTEHITSMINYTEKRIRELQESHSPSMCRLKFRTKNRQGGMEIRDYVWGFDENNGSAILATDPSILDKIHADDEKSRDRRKLSLERYHDHLRSRFPEYELPRIRTTTH